MGGYWLFASVRITMSSNIERSKSFKQWMDVGQFELNSEGNLYIGIESHICECLTNTIRLIMLWTWEYEDGTRVKSLCFPSSYEKIKPFCTSTQGCGKMYETKISKVWYGNEWDIWL